MPETLLRGERETPLTIRVLQDSGIFHKRDISRILRQAPNMVQKRNSVPEKRNYQSFHKYLQYTFRNIEVNIEKIKTKYFQEL